MPRKKKRSQGSRKTGYTQRCCPKCGRDLVDVGNYKWDCPNDCFPTSLELGQMKDIARVEGGDY